MVDTAGDGAADPSPVRGAASMFRCPVCDATGKIGTTFGLGGTACNLCQGRCFLNRAPIACPSCDAKGGHPALFGLRWNTCRLCHGVKYLMDRPCPCPKCRATGLVKSFKGMFSTPCDLCDGQRYLRQPHGRCIKCNFTSRIMKYFRPCINCGGIGYSPEPQHLCPRCSSSGSFRGHSCMLCAGSGVIHHEVVACAKCGGAGDIKRPLSLFLGKQSCPTCNGQGYFQVFSSGSASAAQQNNTKSARKRDRSGRTDGSGAGAGNRVPQDDGEDDEERDDWREGRDGAIGGSEPRRRVKGRRTPVKEESRRQTMDHFDRPDLSPLPSNATAATGRASTGGIGFSRGDSFGSLDGDIGFPQANGLSWAGGASRNGGAGSGVSGETRVFSPGVAGPSDASSSKGKRRRQH